MRRLAALVVAGSLLAAPASAHAAGERAALIARELRRDGLFVSSDLARVATPAHVAEIRAAMDRWDEPVFVVWAPAYFAEPGVRTSRDLAAQVRDQVGRPGAFVFADEDGSVDLEATGVRLPIKPLGAGNDTFDDVPTWKPPSDRIVYLLDYARTGKRPTKGDGEAYLDRDDRAGGTALEVFGAATVLTLVGLLVRRTRRGGAPGRRRPSAGPPARDEIVAALARLDAAIERADAPPAAALEAREAASAALARRRRGGADEVGAFVLARLGLERLHGRDPRPCFFNPLHPWATERVRYAHGREATELPACRSCAQAMRAGRSPESFHDRGKPYWERDTVWARTGFGAFDADVARDVLAGDR